MLLPTQDDELINNSAKALREKYMDYGFGKHAEWGNNYPYKEYWQSLARAVLEVAEKEGYHKGLPANIEEALNSGDGVYRP